MLQQPVANLQLNQRPLKEILITIGLRALRDGDMARVQLIAEPLRAREGTNA